MTNEGYFMSQEQQDAVIGRLARERTEVERQLALLEAELQKYRDMFLSLAKVLGEVDYILFDNERWPENLYQAAGWKMSEYQFSTESINGNKLKTLCKEIREAKAKRDGLVAQLKNLGL
jgi:hypothetical protein